MYNNNTILTMYKTLDFQETELSTTLFPAGLFIPNFSLLPWFLSYCEKFTKMSRGLGTRLTISNVLWVSAFFLLFNTQGVVIYMYRVEAFATGIQARRQGGFEGVRANPPFDRQKTSKLHILSILPFEGGPLVSLLLRITAVQTSLHGCSCSTGFFGGQPGTRA